MMPQLDAAPVREYTQQETLLALLNELISLTGQLTATADRDEIDLLSGLAVRRDDCIKKLQLVDAEMYRRHDSGNEHHEEVLHAFRELTECSKKMQETLERKSKSTLATLTSLQQHRFYSV